MASRDMRIAQIDHSLTNHPPVDAAVVARFEEIREQAKALGVLIVDLVPVGREASLAVTHLEETVMWAIKGIALNQDEVTG